MNHKTLKIIGIITMTLDHIGEILLPEASVPYLILRSIGRIAFVVFAYLISEGFAKTSNVRNYFLRLFLFAAGIELFVAGYYFVTGENYLMRVNVIWPLVFGLAALILLFDKRIYVRLLAIPIVFLAEYLNIQYGAYGVMLIVVFALNRNIVSQFLLTVGLNLIFINQPLLQLLDLSAYARYDSTIQWFSLLGFIFIFLYNGKMGKHESKWFFYIYYPAHLLVLFAISFLIGMF